jgi:hypothetical protein
MSNKSKINGVRVAIDSVSLLTDGGNKIFDFLKQVKRVVKQHRDDMVLEEFSHYLEQRAWTDASGYVFRVRRHPLARSSFDLIAAVNQVTQAVASNPREVIVETHQDDTGVTFKVEVAVICNVFSVGD